MAAPAAPSELAAYTYETLNDSRVKILLVWRPGSTAQGVFAKLEFCTGAACGGFTQFDTAPSSFYFNSFAQQSQYIDGVLRVVLPLTLYRFRIRNERNGEFSSYTNIAEVTTLDTPPVIPPGTDTSVPLTPTTLALGGSGNTINLTWVDNATNETAYLVERRFTTGLDLAWYTVTTLAADSVSYSDTGLAYQTNYAYRVRASNLYGYSFYSNEVNRTTGSLTVANLGAPGLTSATLENASTDPQIKLIWTDNATTETAYYVERKSSDSAAGFTVIYISGANVLTYTDPTVFYNVTYTYRVRAFRSGDGAYSPYSSEVAVTVGSTGSGGTSDLTAVNYGIRQFYSGANTSEGAVIRDNDMENNGQGNIQASLLQTPFVTVDNPQAENLFIRRGVTIYP